MFEYLVERGALVRSDELVDAVFAAMLQRRQDWIDQVVALAYRWSIPLTGIRTIHECVVGFNWSAMLRAIIQANTMR